MKVNNKKFVSKMKPKKGNRAEGGRLFTQQLA